MYYQREKLIFYLDYMYNAIFCCHVFLLKSQCPINDHLEIQHPKDEHSRLGFVASLLCVTDEDLLSELRNMTRTLIESDHER